MKMHFLRSASGCSFPQNKFNHQIQSIKKKKHNNFFTVYSFKVYIFSRVAERALNDFFFLISK